MIEALCMQCTCALCIQCAHASYARACSQPTHVHAHLWLAGRLVRQRDDLAESWVSTLDTLAIYVDYEAGTRGSLIPCMRAHIYSMRAHIYIRSMHDLIHASCVAQVT